MQADKSFEMVLERQNHQQIKFLLIFDLVLYFFADFSSNLSENLPIGLSNALERSFLTPE